MKDVRIKHTIKIKDEYNPNQAEFRVGGGIGVLFAEQCVHQGLTQEFVDSNSELSVKLLTDNQFLFSKYLEIKSEFVRDDEVAK